MSIVERLKINVPAVVHETIDDETIVLHLAKGTYYSLLGVGAEIWRRIDRGMSVHELIAGITRDYDGSPPQIAAAVQGFLEELVQEGLSVSNGASTETGASPDQASSPGTKTIFETPILTRYTDMQDLLMLDPIHDVDAEAGWPTSTPVRQTDGP